MLQDIFTQGEPISKRVGIVLMLYSNVLQKRNTLILTFLQIIMRKNKVLLLNIKA